MAELHADAPLDNQFAESTTDIAIIGISARFPGARNVAEFWRNLRDGVESISFFTDEELTAAGVEPTAFRSPDYVRAAGVLSDVELFDAAFFGFNPKDAETLDPQQRIFLESSWEALEDAGYNPETYNGLIGVYGGSSASSYLSNLYSHPELVSSLGDFQLNLGNDKDNLTTNVSYKLNLKGPSMAVQAACSTSLVAVCVACQNLLSYQCDMALAGGVRVVVPQTLGYFYQEGGIMSPDGHCRAFDAQARGTVGGNGVGLVVLKRLDDALADGDHVYAVIKGAGVNNDGAVKVGYTAPSIEGQAQVISLAQAVAGVEVETITYVEAHGTGTDLGDPIEVAALTQAFRTGTLKKNFCALGSVKTNIGHLDTASGVAGLIKTVLALKHRLIPPSLNFEQPNPRVDFADSPFYVNSRLAEWKTDGEPRRAGVSSFGIGGTNAHVVLEEAPLTVAVEDNGREQLLVLSARSRPALEAATANLTAHLKQHPELNLVDVAYTLQVGRRAFSHRRALVCRSVEDAVSALEAADTRRVLTSERTTAARPVVFMFPGQGAQHARMARDVYMAEPFFRALVDRCCELLRPQLGLDLREALFAESEQALDAASQLQQTRLAQPALFVIEYALARLWMEWGVAPKAMVGHSIGEYVAACLAGVFSLEDALALVAARGRLMQRMPAGAMLAVPLAAREVEALLDSNLELAAINNPSLCVVSGPTEAVARLETRLAAEGLACHRLQTSHAFHSQMMEPVLEEFAAEVSRAKLNPPQLSYVSNLTGEWATAEQATDPQYWVEHLRRTVRFSDNLERLFANPEWLLLEVGPGQTLSGLARQHPARPTAQAVLASLPHRNDEQSDASFMLNTLGRLWLAGAQVNWQQLRPAEQPRRVSLPTYPFERRRFWVDYQAQAESVSHHQLSLARKPDIADWFYLPSWKRSAPAELFRRLELKGQRSRWLLFSDACGVGATLAQALEQSNQDVTLVVSGEHFARRGEHLYELNAGRSDDYKKLFAELRAADKAPQRVVHLWSVTPGDEPRAGEIEGFDQAQRFGQAQRFDNAQQQGFYSLLYIAQAVGDLNLTGELRLDVVSSNAQAVTGEELLCPEKATLRGPVEVIPQEYPQITCRSIDFELRAVDTRSSDKLITQLMSELTALAPGANVAYRGNHRWTQIFEAVHVDAPPAAADTRLRERGVYLITGGMGGIGLVLAEHLAKTLRARLALVNRSSLPARQAWDEWLASHDELDETSRKLRKLRQLEAAGAEVLVFSADVADRAAMFEVVRQTREQFGDINGVIHSAGVAGGRMIQLQTPQIAGGVLAPKAKGLLVLEEALAGMELDFLLLCSSLSAIEAPLGQVDYCSANAFLDAYAHRASLNEGRNVISVNWDAWQEVGMAVNTTIPRDLESWRAESLERGILPAEGVEAFMRVLRAGAPQVAVSTTDLGAALEASAEEDRGDEIVAAEISQPSHARPELTVDYITPRNELEQGVAGIWQELLGVGQVGVYDNFFELGGHSLLALQLVSRLRAAFQAEVSLQLVFNSPTVADLAAVIEQSGQAARAEAEKIEETLRLVEQLSESELQELLALQDSIQESVTDE
jgi:acyl transferase domain-containing protein/acyl carrier protein